MSNYKLVDFKNTPQDNYTKAICRVLIDDKYIVAFFKKQFNDSCEWKAAKVGVDVGQEKKKYYDGFAIDSQSENIKLLAFVEQCEREAAPQGEVPF